MRSDVEYNTNIWVEGLEGAIDGKVGAIGNERIEAGDC